jgi:hypothetical protein
MDRKNLNYGAVIRASRQKKNLKSKELAKKLGISPAFLSLIETNERKPNGDLVLLIQEELGLTNEDLIKKIDPGLENDTKDVFNISLLEDLDIRPNEADELVKINPKIAKALVRLAHDHNNREHEVGEDLEKKIIGKSTWFPGEIVSEFIQKNENYFPKLEEFAHQIFEKVKINNRTRYVSLCDYLEKKYKLAIKEILPKEKPFTKIYFPEKNELHLSDYLSLETKKLYAANQIAQLGADKIINEYLDDFSFPSEVSKKVTKVALLNYTGAAIMMDYKEFYRECMKCRYDLEVLASSFAVSFEQTAHRVTSLNNPDMKGIPLHMIRVDRCGNVSKRFSLSGIELPRASGACPLWNVFTAFSNPNNIHTAISKMTDGSTYFCIAKTVDKGIAKYGESRSLLSIGLGCNIKHAKQMVYSDGINLDDKRREVSIGVSCRRCDRLDCSQRAFPPATTKFDVDLNSRGVSIFVND